MSNLTHFGLNSRINCCPLWVLLDQSHFNHELWQLSDFHWRERVKWRCYSLEELTVDFIVLTDDVHYSLIFTGFLVKKVSNPVEQAIILESFVDRSGWEVLKIHEHWVVNVNQHFTVLIFILDNFWEAATCASLSRRDLYNTWVCEDLFVKPPVVHLIIDENSVFAWFQVGRVHERFLFVFLKHPVGNTTSIFHLVHAWVRSWHVTRI